ncbi:hypothetical protein N7450_002021 [Penicillium hetheringtonii]|uniref:Metallo-beta-lactamase domain-containing protein n=1 Tax=Penicillium hetheringtonii TaxID=911720 RepID=A0AAD6E5Q0_9EURO|nr:hypothetical protein N7450_002021 [Penicillium hetheringtonii]
MACKRSPPEFHIPASPNTVNIRIIDSTTRIGKLALEFLMEPPMNGMQYMPIIPSWSFLIEHGSGKKLLFDMGVPKEWRKMAPVVVKSLESHGWDINVDKEVIDILSGHGLAADEISGIIWSHWHWDHIGDPSRFPSSTELIVGPGFSDHLLPGYPKNPDSPVRESDLSGRNLREIRFSNDVKIGRFRALDFFGDGSFYLLDTPGHTIGHLGGLARTTTNPNTFIFMGGDLCHHGGEIRPSNHLQIPSDINILDPPNTNLPCPGAAIYDRLQASRNRSSNQPFFDPGMASDIEETKNTISKAQEADSRGNIWFIYSHDPSLLGIADLFPLSANEWKKHNWRQKTLWAFLQDFSSALKLLRENEHC